MEKRRKKLTVKPKTLDVEYADFVTPAESQARHVADSWRLCVCCWPETKPMQERLFSDMKDEVENAIRTGDAGFFRRFARHLENHKEPSKLHEFIFWVGTRLGPDMFTQAEWIKIVKLNGFFRSSEDDNALRQIKRLLKKFNFRFKNSPKKR